MSGATTICNLSLKSRFFWGAQGKCLALCKASCIESSLKPKVECIHVHLNGGLGIILNCSTSIRLFLFLLFCFVVVVVCVCVCVCFFFFFGGGGESVCEIPRE